MAFVKIKDLQLFDYHLKLKYPLFIRGHSLKDREGAVIKMTSEKGDSIYVDFAPLPHFHKESLKQSKKAFFKVKEKLLNTHWSLKLLLKEKHILLQNLAFYRFPALFFALEFAILCHLMPKLHFFQEIKVNGLLAGSDEEIFLKASYFKDRASIKLKVGNRTPSEMLTLLEKLNTVLPNKKYRIDINKTWTINEARFFCERFPIELCEYLEEPLQNSIELLTFSHDVLHPIAFDESLLDTPLDFLLSLPTKAALIIKPFRIGSIQKINDLYSKSRFHNLQFILTSTFESGLGHLMIAHLAHFYAIDNPIGLDTYSYLEDDILSKKLEMYKGVLNLKENHILSPYLNMQVLKTIYENF